MARFHLARSLGTSSQEHDLMSDRDATPASAGSGSAPALSVDHLSKRFGDRFAFDDVSFEVGQGEVFGFLERRGDHVERDDAIAYCGIRALPACVVLFAQPAVASAIVRAPDILAQVVFTPLLACWSIWVGNGDLHPVK
jgi:hypothetical protein